MFDCMSAMQCEAVHCFQKGDFRAIIVIHKVRTDAAITSPAATSRLNVLPRKKHNDCTASVGGCRIKPYESEQAALNDAMRLAQGMSYKAVMANLPNGGAKSVLIEPAGPYDRRALFEWFGQCVDSLNGRYVTAMDVGTRIQDMDWLASQTPYVCSSSKEGSPAPHTATGVLVGMSAAVNFKLGKPLGECRVAIQGLGNVGFSLAKNLLHQGATVWAADPDEAACEKARSLGATIVPVTDVHALDVDVFAPCALGSVINNTSVNELKCQIVAGSANNQLATPEDGARLHNKNILYAPDYIINAGGLMYAAGQYNGFTERKIQQDIEGIYDTLTGLFRRAASQQMVISHLAELVAIERLDQPHYDLSA